MPGPASSSPSPLPTQAPSVSRRRRRQQLLPPSSSGTTPTSASATSSSSGSSSGLSFPSFSPSPSPFHHRFLSPLRASAVPFSWEHRPGIPKTPARAGSSKPAAKTLPLPPSLFSSKVGAAAGGYLNIVPADAEAASRWRHQRRRRRRPPALAATLTDWLAVLSLYRSCTRSRDCLAGTPPPRPCSPAKAA